MGRELAVGVGIPRGYALEAARDGKASAEGTLVAVVDAPVLPRMGQRVNSVPCSKPKPSTVIHSPIWATFGLWSSPPDEAAIMKKRLGQVGPGIDARQPSQTANSLARAFSTGS